MKARGGDTAAVLRTGTVTVLMGEKREPPPAPTRLQDLNGRHMNPGHRKSYLRHSCGFCGQRMRSARQRTNHSNECRK